MKIQLVIVDENLGYLDQLTTRLMTEYHGRLEIHGFTSPAAAQESLPTLRPHVLLVSDSLPLDGGAVRQRTAFGRLVDSAGVATADGDRAVARYTRLDEFYRQVVTLLDHSVGSMQMRSRKPGTSTRVVPVISPAGGVGTSSVAIALARSISTQPDGPTVVSLMSCPDSWPTRPTCPRRGR